MTLSYHSVPLSVSPWIPGRRGRLALASLGFALHQTCEAAVPITVGIVIDIAIVGSDAAGLALGIGILLAVFLVLLNAWRFGEMSAMGLYTEMDYSIRRDLLARVLDPIGHARRRSGEALSTMTSDVGEVSSVAWVLGRSFAYAVAILVAATGLLLISVPLGVAVLVIAPVLVLIVHFVTGPLERRAAAEQAALADSSAIASDLLSGLRTVKGLNAEGEAGDRFRRANATTLRAALRTARAEGVFAGATTLLSGLFLVVLAWMSAQASLDGSITAGQLVTVVGLAQFLQWPLAALAFLGPELATVRASRTRILDLAGAQPDVARAAVAAPHGRVRVQTAEQTLDIEPGELVGVAAAEEQTIALGELFAGTRADAADTVLIDGEPLLRPPVPGRVGVISAPHHAALLAGSVADNVGVAERADIAEAAALVDVLAVDGWDREVGERGRMLSGGQRQRVALARALASDAPVLVLREPTTAIDAATEVAVASGIRELRRGRTTILLTRSRTLLAVCDRVVEWNAQGERA